MMLLLASFTAPVESAELQAAEVSSWVDQYMDPAFIQDLMQTFVQVTAMGFCIASILALIMFAVYKAISLLQI